MSGHSKWAKIKRQKGLNDNRRGALFTKLARNITLAAKEGGGDPDTNFSLRIAVDKARAVNMPSENIERSINKALGGDDKSSFQKISYEAVTGDGVYLIIDCQTDNTNRTVSEIKKILEMAGAKLGSVGSVSWQFDEFGLVVVEPYILNKAEKFGKQDEFSPVKIEEIEMQLFDIDGIEDIEESVQDFGDGRELVITTLKNSFAKVLKEIEHRNLKIVNYELIKKPKEFINPEEEIQLKVKKLVLNLEDHDDVDSVWTNIKGI
jgi:YebC/PmpR family DNA-binding regulatory protein